MGFPSVGAGAKGNPMLRPTLLGLLLVAPALADTAPDFGTDTSQWAHDEECDDPRFVGEGMTDTPLLDDDIRADASDCRAAWEAGTIRLRETAKGARPAALSAADGIMWQGIALGDDSSDFANDGECDDRRFTGTGMAESLHWENVGRDATDCRAALSSGAAALWDREEALSAANCRVIDFGDDSSDFADDGECDDPRFEGAGTDGVMVSGDIRKDASDCRRLCEFGVIGLRDYRSY